MTWHCVYTLHRQEERAAMALEAVGQVYLPRFRRIVHHARISQVSMRPLFPRYLFACGHVGEMRRAKGVHSVVSHGTEPIAVPDSLVQDLMSAESRWDDDPPPVLSVGGEARVIGGPFCDFVGRVLSIDARARVKVLLSLLGGQIEADLSAGDLVAV